jgi:histone-lysine N-methyltransferase SETD3
MSRQNEIPSKVGFPTPTLALIPLWDLCNHSSGHISTFYNDENLTCDCYAQRDFKANEEFTIFYGPRTNSELLLQQGFVYRQNEFDKYPIKLGECLNVSAVMYLRYWFKVLSIPITETPNYDQHV